MASYWRPIKPYFSDKGNFPNKIMISEKGCIASDDRRLSEILNTLFINITKNVRSKTKYHFYMDGKRENLTGDISADILNGCVDSYISVLTKILNASLERGCFPNQLKLAEVSKREDELNKKNYRPVSVLCHAFMIFERIVFRQMNLFFESRFSPLLNFAKIAAHKMLYLI